ncbi:MAG: hypothetical protein IAE78_00995 [Myxococcus sp.]|nr:hypothetical protein [Myxococcus sp.]
MRVHLPLVVVSLGLLGCGRPALERDVEPGPTSADAGASQSAAGAAHDAGGASDAGAAADAGLAHDAGSHEDGGTARDGGPSLTWERDTRPIFERHCTRCHESGNLGVPSFADRFAAVAAPSLRCANQTVGTCIGWVLTVQMVESQGRCRTWDPMAFHRESFACVSQQDVAVVQGWIAGGLRER